MPREHGEGFGGGDAGALRIDSSGLHALVHARETAGTRLRLGTVNPVVRRVLEMTSLLGHLERSDDPTNPG
jgi:anti-anti-sigma regulatory factor